MQANDPIRIGFIIDSLRLAGTQRALVNLVEGLTERGYEQRVYCLNKIVHPNIEERLKASQAKVIVIGKWQVASGAGILRLFGEFRSWRPSILQTFLPVSDVLGRTLGKLADLPIIVTSIRARNIDKRPWQLWLDRRTMGWADRVVFNARNVIPFSKNHEGVKPEQVVTIPNGVEIETDIEDQPQLSLREELDISEKMAIIGTVGRLSPQKGHSYLFQALAKLKKRHPNVVLLVIGGGMLRGELENLTEELGIASQVRFLGERTDVNHLLRSLDIYVHGALFEGMPNAVMEAMAVGIPVVATAVDGVKELITHGETGWLMDHERPETMADQIASLLEDEVERRRIGDAAAQLIGTEYSLKKMVGTFDTLYRDLLKSKLGDSSPI